MQTTFSSHQTLPTIAYKLENRFNLRSPANAKDTDVDTRTCFARELFLFPAVLADLEVLGNIKNQWTQRRTITYETNPIFSLLLFSLYGVHHARWKNSRPNTQTRVPNSRKKSFPSSYVVHLDYIVITSLFRTHSASPGSLFLEGGSLVRWLRSTTWQSFERIYDRNSSAETTDRRNI